MRVKRAYLTTGAQQVKEWVNLRGNLRKVHFERKCNGPNGLSVELIHIQSLESYQLDDLPAGRNKKESQHVSRGSGQRRFDCYNLIGIG